MKVYINTREQSYSGGMVLVAANNISQAQELLIQTFPDDVENYDSEGCIEFDEEYISYSENTYYKKENWRELKNVFADYDKPTFIYESGYSE